ncbi:MAG: chemotaxis protein CheW [Gemmatimonadales bacterium]
MADVTVVRLLVFRVGPLACAAAAEAVREILPRLPTIRIPGAPPVVAGLVNVRGGLVTVVEGWRALGQPDPGEGQGGTTVLLEVGPQRRPLGLTVDEVLDLLAIPGDQLEGRQTLPGLDAKLVSAVGRRGERVFVVLDTEALLAPILSS